MGKREIVASIMKLSDVSRYNLALPPAYSLIFNYFDFKELWDPQASLCLRNTSFLGDPYLGAYRNYYIWALSRVYVRILVLTRIVQYWQNS
jgi:hypothetical protein